MANPYPSPKKTPRKTTKSRKRKLSTSTSKKRKRIIKRRIRYKRYAKNARPINVAADREGNSRSYKKQKVTRSQQKLINKRFKNGYSPFINRSVDVLQLTQEVPNKAKWIWRCNNGIDLIKFAFSKFPLENNNTGATISPAQNSLNSVSQEQSIYFGQQKYTYEIRNPCNYDINLVIYDIVYKSDTDSDVGSTQVETLAESTSINILGDNPLGLISRGLNSLIAQQVPSASTGTTIVADPNSLTSSDRLRVNIKPTDSYPFNIYCKIVKKHTFRLQPGATMKHTFVHRPKAMITRGYLSYKYSQYFTGTGTGASNVNIGIKDFSSGCLFKVWGQVLNSGTDDTSTTPNNRNLVTLGSGNIALYENVETKWYTMDNKYSYIFNTDGSWNPTATDYAKLENPTDIVVQTIEDVNDS